MKPLTLTSCIALFGISTLACAQSSQIELPLSGPAYRLATEAYRDYSQGDYAKAAEKAREAVRLRPDVPRLKELLDKSIKMRDAVLNGERPRHADAKAAPGKNPAFRAADIGFKALARKDYIRAEAAASEAVRLAPANRVYRMLLADALIGNHRLDKAESVLKQALNDTGDADGKIRQRLGVLQLSLAAKPVQEYYAAQREGKTAAALAAAQKAVGFAPDVLAYRLMLISALATENRLTEAEQQADAAIALAPKDPAPLALRAYLKQSGGKTEEASRDLDQAIRLAGQDRKSNRNIRLIAADAALAAGNPERAKVLLTPVADKGDLLVAARLQDDGSPGERIFVQPELDCQTAVRGQVCSVVPGVQQKDRGYDTAAVAYEALAARDYPKAVSNARAAYALAPANQNYSLLLIKALLANGENAQAEQMATQALQKNSASAELLFARGNARKRQAKTALAQEDFRRALQLGRLPENLDIELLLELGQTDEAAQRFALARKNGKLTHLTEYELGYLAARVGDSKEATRYFTSADSAGKLPDTALQDTAYAALRSGEIETAVRYFNRATDLNRQGKLLADAQSQYETRRTVAELTRTWGLITALSYRGMTGKPGVANNIVGANNNSSQLGTELYWRPFGYQNQNQLEIFGRGFTTLSSRAGDPVGGSTTQGAVGARLKPIGDMNLNFSISRLFAVGSQATNDWLAQASYFYGIGGDLRQDTSSWWTANVSAEAGRYIRQANNYALVTAIAGRSYRLPGNLDNVVALPHLSLASDYASYFANRASSGIGPGIIFRFWFNENAYAAHRSYGDLSLQYRWRLSGDERAKGAFINLVVSY